jgi:hypothetical protein
MRSTGSVRGSGAGLTLGLALRLAVAARRPGEHEEEERKEPVHTSILAGVPAAHAASPRCWLRFRRRLVGAVVTQFAALVRLFTCVN